MFDLVRLRRGFGLAGNLGMVLLLCASAAADDKPAASRTFLGMLDGAPKNSLIAVVVEGSEVLAYACSEDENFNKTNSRWLRGAAAEGALQAANDGVKLEAKIGEDAVAGTLTGPDKKELKFTATPAGENGGLFRAEGKVGDEEHVAGWIADGRGTVVGSHHHKQFGGSGKPFGGTGGKPFGGTGGSGFHAGGPSFHHVQTFKFPSNHAFHNDFNFNQHFFFQQQMQVFHAKKVFHVPPHSGKK
jgi:hypothetical protein